MTEILLCDDDPFFLSVERGVILSLIYDEGFPIRLLGEAQSFSGAVNLIRKAESNVLMFLDLDFGKNSPTGIDISSAVKRISKDIRIVFTTNHSELAMNVLKGGIEPFGFLEKGTDIASLTDGLRRYIRMALSLTSEKSAESSASDKMNLSLGSGEVISLSLDDIIYIETEKKLSHGITYHTAGWSKITVIGTLDGVEKQLDGFIRIHRSYLINPRHFVSMKGNYAVLSDRSEIPCSLKNRAKLKNPTGTNGAM